MVTTKESGDVMKYFAYRDKDLIVIYRLNNGILEYLDGADFIPSGFKDLNELKRDALRHNAKVTEI